jgi:hypothetical protein
MTDPEILLAATRYEKVRKLNPREYSIPRNDESLSTSMGTCKEIFEKLTTFDSDLDGCLPILEFFVTRATFGCNGYQQANNGNL